MANSNYKLKSEYYGFKSRREIDYKSKNINWLLNVTTAQIKDKDFKLGNVRAENSLRRQVYLANKSVYDQYKRLEKAVKESNGQLHSKYLEVLQDKYKIRRLSVSKLNKMSRVDLMYEINRLKYALNQQTFSIEGSKKYTAKLKQLGVDSSRLNTTTSSDDWKILRELMQEYDSETVMNAYAICDYDAEATREYLNNGYTPVINYVDPEPELDPYTMGDEPDENNMPF